MSLHKSKRTLKYLALSVVGKILEPSQVKVRAIRQAGSGRVLLVLGENLQNKAAFCNTVKIILGSNATAVYYTHLDVYKRQEHILRHTGRVHARSRREENSTGRQKPNYRN